MDGAITGGTNITISGELDAATLDISGNADIDGTTNLDAVDIDGAVQIDATVTVGVDDTGYDVKFFGDTASAYMLWDASADDLVLAGAAGIDLAGDLDVDGTANLDVVDIDGAVDMASTLTLAGNADFNGDLDVDGTTNLDVVDIDGAVDMASTLTVAGTTHLSSTSPILQATASNGSSGLRLNVIGQSSGNLFRVQDDATTVFTVDYDGSTTIAGALDVDGTTNLDAVDIDGAVQIDGTVTVGVDDTGKDVKFFGATSGSYLLWDESADSLLLTDSTPIKIGDAQDMTLYHDGTNSYLTNAVGALKVATETSGIAITIGHTTSETTVADNLTVTGNASIGGDLDVTGSFDMSDANITNIGSIALDTITNDGTDITLDSSGDIVLDAGGADIFFKDDGTTFGSATNSSGNLIIKSGTTTALTFSGANITAAGTVTAGGILKTDDTTEATSTTDGSLQTDGGLSVAKDAVFGDDVKLLSDAAVLNFGADSDVNITHVADTGLLLNSTMQLQFNDASQYINAPSATVLDINATDEVEINATLADINANLDVSGTYTGGGLMTTGGNIVIPNAGNIGSASDTDAIAIASNGVVTFSQVPVLPNDTIETADIQDNAVTLAKMAGLAQGKIIYGDSSGDPAALTIGSANTFLKSDGTDVSWAVPSVAADDLATGDGAINLVTTSGNITIDAQANDADVIIKVDDNGTAVTAVTFDGSDAGNAIFVNDVQLKSDGALLEFGADLDTTLTHTDGTGLTLNSTNKLTFGDAASFVQQSGDGVLRIDGEATIDMNASTAVTVSNDLKLDSDAAVLGFGADNDVTLTHVADTGLLLNTNMQLQFRDSAIYVTSAADGHLDLIADSMIDIDSGNVRINYNELTSDFVAPWSTSGMIFPQTNGTAGILYSHGSYRMSLMHNGFRKASSEWHSTAVNSTDEAAGIEIDGVAGKILFETELNKATGETNVVTTAGYFDSSQDLWLTNDLKLDSDASVIHFGADQDVTLTHVADTGLLLNGTMQLQFNDASQNITAPNATTLDINATDEIELNATNIDLNGSVDLNTISNVNTYKVGLSFLQGLSGSGGTYAETDGKGFITYCDASNYTRILAYAAAGGTPVFQSRSGSAIKSEIESNGDFQSATDSYVAVSDERLKENIEDSGSQWNDIKAMRVRKYSFKEENLDTPNMIGVIAQELEASGMSGLVKTKPNMNPPADGNGPDEPVLDADGNPTDYKVVKTSIIHMKAVKALQEAMARIESLETRIAKLES